MERVPDEVDVGTDGRVGVGGAFVTRVWREDAGEGGNATCGHPVDRAHAHAHAPARDDARYAADELQVDVHAVLPIHAASHTRARVCALVHDSPYTASCAARVHEHAHALHGRLGVHVATPIPAACCMHELDADVRVACDTMDAHALARAPAYLLGDMRALMSELAPARPSAGCPPPALAPATPAWHSASVLSIGHKGVFLPRNSLPPGASSGAPESEWSMCAWLWWNGPQDAAPANLFFKGPGAGSQQRTPSVWIDAASHKLMLRVSYASDADAVDMGGDTISPLPVHAWAHLCFTFRNASGTSQPDETADGASYTMQVYMNGALDSILTVSAPAVVGANTGPLYIGAHPSLSSAQGLLADLRVFDSALGTSAVQAEFQRLAWLYARSSHDEMHPMPELGLRAHETALHAGVAAAVDLLYPRALLEADTLSHEQPPMCELCAMGASAGGCDCSRDRYALACAVAQVSDAANQWRIACTAPWGGTSGQPVEHVAGAAMGRALAELRACNVSGSIADADKAYDSAVRTLHGAWTSGQAGDGSAAGAIATLLLAPGRDACAADLLRHAPSAVDRRDVGRVHAALGTVRTLLSSARQLVFGAERVAPSDMAWNEQAAARLHSNATLARQVVLRLLLRRQRHPHLGCRLAAEAAARGDAHALYTWGLHVWLGVCDSHGARAELGVGLMHVAAMRGYADAWMFLSRWYAGLTPSYFAVRGRDDTMTPAGARDVEAAGLYIEWAADDAARLFDTPGAQQSYEFPTLARVAAEADTVEAGEHGIDDATLQFYHDLADTGHVPSLNFLAAAYYWGQRGLPRDQVRGAGFWRAAANAGNADAQVALAGLYIRGEGVPMNHSTAVEWYTKAAAQNATAALNGLGFAHFKGLYGVRQDASLAYSYFARAVEQGTAGDSFVNAAECLFNGLGVARNTSAGFALLRTAAREFGHFIAVLGVGRRLVQGSAPLETAHDDEAEGVTHTRDVPAAFPYLEAAAQQGHWSSLIRRGFDRFLARDFGGALLHFLHADALGVRVGALNAAYLLYHGLASAAEVAGAAPSATRGSSARIEDGWLAQQLFEAAVAEHPEARVPLADLFASGARGATRDVARAMELYVLAAQSNDAEAAFKIADALQGGVHLIVAGEVQHARTWYHRALELAPDTAHRLPCWLGLARLHAAEFFRW